MGMELIGCLEQFTKKMYHRKGNESPLICIENLYPMPLLQQWDV